MRRPWLPLPFQDWLNGSTMARLDAADKGAILDLGIHAWIDEGFHLPLEDDDLMARWSGLPDWPTRKARIMPALEWFLRYLRQEQEVYEGICEKRREAGRRGGQAKAEHESGNCQANAKQMSTPSSPSSPSSPSGQSPPPSPSPKKFEKGSSNRKGTEKTTAEDLANDVALERLRKGAIGKGWITGSEADRLRYVTAAEHSLRVAQPRSTAGHLFASIVSDNNWNVLNQTDEDRARERLKRMDAAGLR